MRSLLVLLGFTLAATAACADRWTEHRSPAFDARHPAGWSVEQDAASGRIVFSSRAGERLVVWPFHAARPIDAAGAPVLLQRFATLVDADAVWGEARNLGPDVVCTTGRGRQGAAVCGLVRLGGNSGKSGYIYYVGADAARLRQNESTYAEILSSVRFKGAAGGARGGAQESPKHRWVTYTDPSESAFGLEVPAEWRVQGGLVRRASVDVTTALSLESPDGEIRIFIGDAQVPAFTVPTPMLTMTGFSEGSWYSPGYGVNLMVMSYRTGVQYAQGYAEWRFGQNGGGVTLLDARQRPEAAQRINQIYQQYGTPMFQSSLAIGEVRFRCGGGSRPLLGYVLAGTTLTQSQGMGLWQVEYLYGYTAPQRRIAEAQAVIEHMVGTVRLNPAWVQMQQNITGQVSRIVTDTNNYISSLVSQTYWDTQASRDETSRRFSNAILGLEDVRDPESGQEYKVESGANYYWIDALGNIAGTELSANPDALRFREMVRLP